DASDTIDQTSDIVDQACESLLAEVLERQGVMEGISFSDFRDADSDFQTSLDMSDEAIVASVVEVSPNNSDEDYTENDSTGDSGPTVAEAAHCVIVMRVFAEKRGLAEKLARSMISFQLGQIGNADQTPVYLDMPSALTVHEKGSRQVTVRSTGNEKMRVSVMLSCTADGHKLPPYVVFKLKTLPKGEKFPRNIVIRCQDKGWNG
ncbi:hypothetical protein MTO96_044087, partial [Rhipicephalus appendiculatus]